MSSTLAILAYSVILMVAVAPLMLVGIRFWRPRGGAAFYGVFFLAIGALQVGFFHPEELPSFRGLATAPQEVSQRQCTEIIRLLEESRVILNRRSAPQLVVFETLWVRLPQEGRDVVVSCVQRSWPEGSGNAQVIMQSN